MVSDPLLDLLVQNGVLDDEQVQTIQDEQKTSNGKTIRQLVIDGGYVTEDDLLGLMAAYQGCDVVDLSSMHSFYVCNNLGTRWQTS